MFQRPFHCLKSIIAAGIRENDRRTTRKATRRNLAPLGPALRDDLGLTCHRQSIRFQNERHQKHSFE